MMGRRVLIVDDERDLRAMLSSYLTADGFEVLEAGDGERALEVALTEAPDLVVLDVGLPGIDGFEVLRRLRQSSEVPVIMLTARTEEVDRVVGLRRVDIRWAGDRRRDPGGPLRRPHGGTQCPRV
jgi:DNA-binding response OmpR family regulator